MLVSQGEKVMRSAGWGRRLCSPLRVQGWERKWGTERERGTEKWPCFFLSLTNRIDGKIRQVNNGWDWAEQILFRLQLLLLLLLLLLLVLWCCCRRNRTDGDEVISESHMHRNLTGRKSYMPGFFPSYLLMSGLSPSLELYLRLR